MRNLQFFTTSIIVIISIIWYVITSSIALACEKHASPFITIELGNTSPDYKKIDFALKKAAKIKGNNYYIDVKTAAKSQEYLDSTTEKLVTHIKNFLSKNGVNHANVKVNFAFDNNVVSDVVTVKLHYSKAKSHNASGATLEDSSKTGK